MMSNPLSKWFKIPTLAERLRNQGVREDLIQAAEHTAFGRQTDAGIPAAGELLDADERVLALVEARHSGAIGLLLLTTRRLVFAPKAGRTGATSIGLPDIGSVEADKHRGMGVLRVRTSSGELVIDQILGTQAQSLATSVEQAMRPPPDGPARARDPLEELAELRALYGAGAIGETEYQTRKQQLFGQI